MVGEKVDRRVPSVEDDTMWDDLELKVLQSTIVLLDLVRDQGLNPLFAL